MYERPRNGGSAEYPSALPFAATVARIRETIAKANLHIFAEIDHAAERTMPDSTWPRRS